MMSFSIEVRDRSNRARLLGRLVSKPVDELTGDRISLVVGAPLKPYEPFPLAQDKPLNISRIDFEVNYRRSRDGYSQHAELLTDTPLGVLMFHPDFRLPGENERQAKYREHMASL